MAIFPVDTPLGLTPLFEEVHCLRAIVASVLEGHLGKAVADDPTHPGVARLDLGCYAIFGGEPTRPAAAKLVDSVPSPKELIFPDSEEWRRLLHQVHGARLSPRPMQAYSAAGLDLDHVRDLANRVPAGVELRRIDAALASELGRNLQPHGMQVFETVEDFAQRGVGFCALDQKTLAGAATSYVFSSDAIELAIATHPDYRGRGLATCVAASLIVDCLERGITPHWNAANPVSKHLAERLGYRPDGTCEVLYLD